MRTHAAAAYPDECCGALLGRIGGARVVMEAWPMINTAPEAARRFLVGASGYRSAEARAREFGVELLGFYHSHPDAPAEPSGYDLSQAWPNLDYVIIAVEQAVPGRMTAWRLRDDRSAFVSEDITWPTES